MTHTKPQDPNPCYDTPAGFSVEIPDTIREIPEPLSNGRAAPGFKFRGMKSYWWGPGKILKEIPFLARCRMNFLMNCYTEFFIGNEKPWGKNENSWRKPLSSGIKDGFEEVVHLCRENNITFCFCVNPGLGDNTLNYDNEQDFDLLWRHYSWMQDLGVQWFSLSYDDIQKGIDPESQSRLVNRLLGCLRDRDPRAQLIFCPTHYTGVGKLRGTNQNDPYLETLAEKMDPEVYLFWTGDSYGAANRRTTRANAENYGSIAGHRLFLWDNYPVNNCNPVLHLGPMVGRDVDLCEAVEGYMINPMCPQSDMSRLPLMTCADYAYNPWDYDPGRSIGQAILHIGETREQQLVLRDLVELYPGNLISPPIINGEPVCISDRSSLQQRFGDLLDLPHGRMSSDLFIAHCAGLLERMNAHFPGQYETSRDVLARDVEEIRNAYLAHYGSPVRDIRGQGWTDS